MSKYRSRWPSSALSAASQAVAQHAPAMPIKLSKFRKSSSSKAVSCFQLDNHIVDELLNNINVSPCQGTVQKEFDKYTAASLSSLETDILHFWEVSYTHINKDKCCWFKLYRSTRQSSQHCLELPWIIFRFRHLLFPVNVYSRLQRKPIL